MLGWEKNIPCRGKEHVQRSWGGKIRVFFFFFQELPSPRSESKGELESGARGSMAQIEGQ